MATTGFGFNLIDGDWVRLRQILQNLSSGLKLGPIAKPTFQDLTINGLTASRLTSTDADKKLASVANLAAWIAGVANEIDIADDGDGTLTVGIVDPLAVNKGGSGQNSYTNGQLLIGNTTGNTLAKATITETANQISVTNGTGSITLATPQDIHMGASPTFDDLTLSTPSNIYALSHDSFANFAAWEHVDFSAVPFLSMASPLETGSTTSGSYTTITNSDIVFDPSIYVVNSTLYARFIYHLYNDVATKVTYATVYRQNGGSEIEAARVQHSGPDPIAWEILKSGWIDFSSETEDSFQLQLKTDAGGEAFFNNFRMELRYGNS